MNGSEAIRLKRTVRKFEDKPLPKDVVHAISNAGGSSQSSKNEQGSLVLLCKIHDTVSDLLRKLGRYVARLVY